MTKEEACLFNIFRESPGIIRLFDMRPMDEPNFILEEWRK